MRKHFAVLAFAMVLLLTTGCIPDDDTVKDTPRASMMYYYTYNADADSTYVSYYIIGFTGMPRYAPYTDTVSFNGKRIFSSQDFITQGFAGFVDSRTFVYYDKFGKTYTHSISGLHKYTLPANFTSLHSHSNDTVYWDGPAYNGTQNVRLDLVYGQQLNESFFNSQRPFIPLDSVWMKLHLPTGINNLSANLVFIGGSNSATGAPRGSTVDIRIQSPTKMVSVY